MSHSCTNQTVNSPSPTRRTNLVDQQRAKDKSKTNLQNKSQDKTKHNAPYCKRQNPNPPSRTRSLEERFYKKPSAKQLPVPFSDNSDSISRSSPPSEFNSSFILSKNYCECGPALFSIFLGPTVDEVFLSWFRYFISFIYIWSSCRKPVEQHSNKCDSQCSHYRNSSDPKTIFKSGREYSAMKTDNSFHARSTRTGCVRASSTSRIQPCNSTHPASAYQTSVPSAGTYAGSTHPPSTHRVSTYPGSTHRDSTYPSGTHRDSTYPSGTHRDSTYPSSTHRNSTYPGSTHRDSTYPGSIHRDSTYPGSTHRDSTYPGSIHRDSTYPGSTHRDSTYPGSSHPASTHRASTYPDRSYRASTYPGSTHPGSYHESESIFETGSMKENENYESGNTNQYYNENEAISLGTGASNRSRRSSISQSYHSNEFNSDHPSYIASDHSIQDNMQSKGKLSFKSNHTLGPNTEDGIEYNIQPSKKERDFETDYNPEFHQEQQYDPDFNLEYEPDHLSISRQESEEEITSNNSKTKSICSCNEEEPKDSSKSRGNVMYGDVLATVVKKLKDDNAFELKDESVEPKCPTNDDYGFCISEIESSHDLKPNQEKMCKYCKCRFTPSNEQRSRIPRRRIATKVCQESQLNNEETLCSKICFKWRKVCEGFQKHRNCNCS